MTGDLDRPDHVGRIMQQWREQRPDLDVSPQGVIGRLHRVAARLTDELVAVYAEYGLGEGEFDILATLRRSGPAQELTPGELAASTMVTSGAATKRVDRLVDRGLVTRRVSNVDTRRRVVTLTEEGRALIDRAFEAHIANEHRLIAPLSQKQRTQLANLLEEWGKALGA